MLGPAARCGYVLQPDCMRDPVFDPTKPQSFGKVEPITLTIVVGHLERKVCMSPFVVCV